MPKPKPQSTAEWIRDQSVRQTRQALRAAGIGPLRYGSVTTAGSSPVVTMADDSSEVTVGAWPSSYVPRVDDVVLVAPFKGTEGQVAIIEAVTLSGSSSLRAQPFAQAAGNVTTTNFGNIAVNGRGNASVTFPVGLFTATPVITLGLNSSVPDARPSSVMNPTTSGFTITQFNGTASASSAGVFWHAIQMSA